MIPNRLDERLIEAAHKGDVDEIARLKALGVELSGVDDDGADLLYHFVWQCGDTERIRRLIGLGVKPVNLNARGGTPLIAAIWTMDPEIVRAVLEAGADPNVIGYLEEDDSASALDTVLIDFCECETAEEHAAMKEIERMIRASGGKVHRYTDWSPPDQFRS